MIIVHYNYSLVCKKILHHTNALSTKLNIWYVKIRIIEISMNKIKNEIGCYYKQEISDRNINGTNDKVQFDDIVKIFVEKELKNYKSC